jgi:hypothetical protein
MKIAAVEAVLDARESAARAANPTMRISEHMVLGGPAGPSHYAG